MRGSLFVAVVLLLPWAGCISTDDNGIIGSVGLGDDFVAPDPRLNEAFFYCRIQPEVLTKYSCAAGKSGEGGGCHDSQSALHLRTTIAPAPCDSRGTVVGPVPEAYAENLEAVQYSVQSDPLTSPLYLRPLNRASHPRAIFASSDPAAKLLLDWIAGAGL